jgi:hypothetical protein
MRWSITLSCMLLVVPALAACDASIVVNDGRGVEGSGTIVNETRDVADFDRITLAGEGTVIVSEADATSLMIETDDNLLVHIDTSVRNRNLEIATKPGIDIDPTDSVVYRLAAPDITGVSLTGAGRFVLGDCEADAFAVSLSGAGDIEVGNLSAGVLDVVIAGAGSVDIAGRVTSLDVTIPGAGSFKGRDLQSEGATVVTSGVGSASVWVTSELSATVSGVGSIEYYGSPTVSQSVSGIGTINSRGDA